MSQLSSRILRPKRASPVCSIGSRGTATPPVTAKLDLVFSSASTFADCMESSDTEETKLGDVGIEKVNFFGTCFRGPVKIHRDLMRAEARRSRQPSSDRFCRSAVDTAGARMRDGLRSTTPSYRGR